MTSPIRLTYVGHATVLLEMDGVRLLTDPILRDRVGFLRRQSNGIDLGRFAQLDAVLLSHVHLDHLDPPSLQLLGPEVPIVAPQGTSRFLRKRRLGPVVEMVAGDTLQIGAVTVRATPAVHGRTRYPWGPAAEPLGYIISGRCGVYFAGDTGYFSEMEQEAGELDVALLPIWGWGFTLGKDHLGPRGAAEAAAVLRPRLAIPVHWGTLCPIGVGWLNPSYLRDPAVAFVQHAADVAPEVSVQVIPPGGTMLYDNGGKTPPHSQLGSWQIGSGTNSC
jgi:L-ascorbate metabolism protein UlaG (beta-lactamase superfamily)